MTFDDGAVVREIFTVPARNDDLVVYLLMRNDLPSLNPGKAMAQAYHAGNQIVKWLEIADVKNYLGIDRQAVENPLYFGTTICLSASLVEITNALRMVT